MGRSRRQVEAISLLTTRVGSERAVHRRLREEGIHSYAPRYLDDRLVEHPLFPCYVFVWVGSRWRDAMSTRGVTGVVRMGGVPCRVRPEVVEAIRARETPTGYVMLHPPLSAEQRVRLSENSTVMGRVLERCSRTRVRVLLEILGREVEMALRERDLIAA